MATHQIAQGIAQLGRNGDSTLVHMQPHEVAGLQAIAKANGTSLTINPETGLPEAFSLGGFFRSLAPTIAGAAVSMIPGMQPFGLSAMQSGIMAGALTGALTNKKNPLMGAAMGGLGGYGGASLANAALNPAAAATQAGVEPEIAMINTPGAMPSATTIAQNPVGFQNAANLNAGLPIGGSSGAQAGIATGAPEATFGSNLAKAGSNIAADPMAYISANKMPLATTLGGAALGGLEPSDLYGNTVNVDSSKGKYNPYASLNLDTDTGLKLYAQGGPVSFADGGDAMKGGGTDAMQGAGLLPLDVSDINAKYNIGEEGGFVPVPRLGLFADNDQIEAARSAYESQLASAMANRGGMGAPYGFGGMNRMMGGMGQPNQPKGLGSLGGAKNTESNQPSMGMVTRTIGSSAPTANTASTAETALTRLNLNKNYANGGSIQAGGLQDLYGTQDAMTGPMLSKEGYGLGRLQQLADGGVAGYKAGGYLDGPGDGMSDSIPATIEGKQPARLADGEFVVPADVVSHLGNGSTKAGSQRLYGMLDKVRKARTGTKKQGKQINPDKYMPA